MRALCGAIITAGALIGLGLSAVGSGLRYGQFQGMSGDGSGPVRLHLWQMDTSLVFILIFLTIVACVGLAVAFLGLAYHHHRRHHEMLRQQNLP
jgi:formate hydrogenlyase subunit 3/multisubunit Na+/H+ antiporter MnhD subunit